MLKNINDVVDSSNNDKKILMSFAIAESGLVVSIRDVRNGLECKCICPVCKGSLIARQGNTREWHFAHDSGVECTNSGETALHMAAKQLLVSVGGMMLPDGIANKEISIPSVEPVLGNAIDHSKYIEFSNIELEKTVGQLRPDVFICFESSILLVEIAVTHFVDDDKLRILKNSGLPTLEISLSALYETDWTWDILYEVIISGLEHKEWIVNINMAELQAKAFDNALDKLIKTPVIKSIESTTKSLGRFELYGAPIEVDLCNNGQGEKQVEATIKKHSRYAFNKLWSLMLMNGGHYNDGIFVFPIYKKDFLVSYLNGTYKHKRCA